jgi:hypothetical protein
LVIVGVGFADLGLELVMASFDARRPLTTITKLAVTLVILLAPFAAAAQTAGAPPSPVCAEPALDDGESSHRTIDREVGRTLNRAIRRVNAEDYADARALVGELNLDQLTPYELAMAEGVLYRVAGAERKLDEAREHVVRAIESCGLTEQGLARAQSLIITLDALRGEARLVAEWAESPCVRPEPNPIASEQPSKPPLEDRLEAFEYLYVAVAGYARCTDVKHKLAVTTSASPEELSQLASERKAAIDELELQAGIFEQRFGYPDGVDVLIASLRGPCGGNACPPRPRARPAPYTTSPWPNDRPRVYGPR